MTIQRNTNRAKKQKYSKPKVTVKFLTTKLMRIGKDEPEMFNLLAADCEWEPY